MQGGVHVVGIVSLRLALPAQERELRCGLACRQRMEREPSVRSVAFRERGAWGVAREVWDRLAS